MNPARYPASLRAARRNTRGGGFTYIGLLIAVAILGITTTATLQMGSVVQRRAAEEELLRIGAEFQAALRSYANATPAGQATAPHSLQDLVKDPRYPNPRRHLRKLYIDPMTGQNQWGTVEMQNGAGIIGVHSMSRAQPIKVGNFDAGLQGLEGKRSYADWIFMIDATAVKPQAAVAVLPR